MKPIATVHWIKDGKEKEKAVYDEKGLYRIMTILYNSKLTYWLCMSSVKARIPPTTQYTPRRDVADSWMIKDITG